VDRAGEIAKKLGATVHVVSCYSKGSSPFAATAGQAGSGEVHEKDVDRTRAEHYVARAQRRLSRLGVASEVHVWPAEPADALVRIADEQGAEMIVVGNRGMTGAKRALGSVPNRVSHHSGCNVLIVATDLQATGS
jgi:nucleotide-binding universal stress UspA family protein